MKYTLKPVTDDELSTLKAMFPNFIGSVQWKKLIPHAKVEKDEIIYECPKRPTVYYNVKTGAVRIPSQDFHKYKKAKCNTQAAFAVRRVKECSKENGIDYMDTKFLPRRLKKGKKPLSDAFVME